MKPREIVILLLGTLGFCSQIAAQFTGGEPNFLIMGASLALLGVAPFLRADEARRGDQDRERGAGRGSEP